MTFLIVMCCFDYFHVKWRELRINTEGKERGINTEGKAESGHSGPRSFLQNFCDALFFIIIIRNIYRFCDASRIRGFFFKFLIVLYISDEFIVHSRDHLHFASALPSEYWRRQTNENDEQGGREAIVRIAGLCSDCVVLLVFGPHCPSFGLRICYKQGNRDWPSECRTNFFD